VLHRAKESIPNASRLDGWRFLERLQAAPRPAPPVIVSTGTDIGEGWADSHGCIGLLLKPFEEPELDSSVL
jgi:CheY-like chemotaxis protein